MSDQHPPQQPHGEQPQQPYGQPQYGQQAPAGYYQQGPPPKKKHTLRNVLLILALLFVLVVGGCIALIGGAANEIDKAIKDEEANDKPKDVSVGKAFTHDDFEVESGWKVVNEEFGGATIEGLRVTNSASEERTAQLSFRFYKGNENLAEVECSSNQLQADETSKMDCFSFDGDFPKGFDSVRVADSW